MEDQLKFFPLLSLKEMALRTTAVLLWSDSDFLASVSRINSESRENVAYHIAQDRVIAKVSQLELPKSLKKQVADVVRPVGLEMRRWRKFLEECFRIGYYNPRRNYLSLQLFVNFNSNGLSDSTTLCWTTTGRIDYQKTVKELRCNAFGVEELYEIACAYCLEDCVALLWDQLSGKAKEYFSNEDNICLGLSFQWPHILKGEQSKLDEWSRGESELNFNQYSFERSAQVGNKSAVEYFYQKLTPEEREASVPSVFPKVLESIDLEDDFKDRMGETFCYFLTLMTPEQQVETLKADPIHVFFCFLDMIWPDLFLENAPLIWKHLPPKDYARLQQIMVEKIEWKGEYFPELLMKLFVQSPPDFKKFFLGQKSESDSLARSFLSKCFDVEDSESVEALFTSLDAADRVELVFHRSVLQFFFQSIIDGEWLMVELCLREATLSREEGERLKRHFVRALGGRDPQYLSQRKLKRLYDFLDAPDASSDDEKRGQKRKLENWSPE